MKSFANIALLVLVLTLLLLTAGASYYRFIVMHDYTVGFETDCDPLTESCFVGCEDDACTEEYYYSYITRSANTLFEICGPDISTCDGAYACTTEDTDCTIEYCDPGSETDTCDTL